MARARNQTRCGQGRKAAEMSRIGLARRCAQPIRPDQVGAPPRRTAQVRQVASWRRKAQPTRGGQVAAGSSRRRRRGRGRRQVERRALATSRAPCRMCSLFISSHFMMLARYTLCVRTTSLTLKYYSSISFAVAVLSSSDGGGDSRTQQARPQPIAATATTTSATGKTGSKSNNAQSLWLNSSARRARARRVQI